MTERATPEERRAAFRVVRGAPSDEEVAALTLVIAAATAPAPAPAAPATRDRWSDPAARFRVPLHPAPGAWRASTWPR